MVVTGAYILEFKNINGYHTVSHLCTVRLQVNCAVKYLGLELKWRILAEQIASTFTKISR